MIINRNAPKNLPFTICQTERGLVSRSSIVPCFLSSEKLRMVTAGIKKINTQGARVKNGFKSAKEPSRRFKSPSNSHKINPFSNKKTAITRGSLSEGKSECTSRNNIEISVETILVKCFIGYGSL